MLKRVERLEGRFAAPADDRLKQDVIAAALQRTSTSDLQALEEAFHLVQEGGQMTADHLAAEQRYEDLIAEECVRFGFKSLKTFTRYCEQTRQPVDRRR